jgi:predicted nucleic acid-binding protein
MRVLLDTCIISDIYRGEKREHLRTLLHSVGDENCFVSVVTLGEIINGIHQLDDGKKKQDLQSWAAGFEEKYFNQLLSVDLEVARIWGQLTAKAKNMGRVIPVADGLIAATAISHDLYVVTENVRDFEPTGARILNPYA